MKLGGRSRLVESGLTGLALRKPRLSKKRNRPDINFVPMSTERTVFGPLLASCSSINVATASIRSLVQMRTLNTIVPNPGYRRCRNTLATIGLRTIV